MVALTEKKQDGTYTDLPQLPRSSRHEERFKAFMPYAARGLVGPTAIALGLRQAGEILADTHKLLFLGAMGVELINLVAYGLRMHRLRQSANSTARKVYGFVDQVIGLGASVGVALTLALTMFANMEEANPFVFTSIFAYFFLANLARSVDRACFLPKADVKPHEIGSSVISTGLLGAGTAGVALASFAAEYQLANGLQVGFLVAGCVLLADMVNSGVTTCLTRRRNAQLALPDVEKAGEQKPLLLGATSSQPDNDDHGHPPHCPVRCTLL